MKKLIACTLAGALMLVLNTNAYATTTEIGTQSDESSEKIIENDLSELKKSYNKEDSYRIPTGNDTVIEIGVNEFACSITLPVTLSDVSNQGKTSNKQAIFQDDTGTFTNHASVTDLGLEILTVINSEEAPDEYTFKTEADDSISLKKSVDSEDVILVYNSKGLVVAVVENLMANDANGNVVETVLDIRNNEITQSISKENSNITYPLTSGINVYSTGSAENLLDWFNDAHWIWRGNELSLRLYPKDWCKSLNVTTALKEATWSAIYNYFHTEGYWSNTDGMRHQYLCHVDYAKYESDWNLEPWRPNVGYSATVTVGCNPV